MLEKYEEVTFRAIRNLFPTEMMKPQGRTLDETKKSQNLHNTCKTITEAPFTLKKQLILLNNKAQ